MGFIILSLMIVGLFLITNQHISDRFDDIERLINQPKDDDK
jgi:hypothetical protein